jgi:signal transduction histidine kinase
MKKVALVFVLAVFVPSLVLAWLAVRSLRDQQFVLEREQSLLYQAVADSVAKGVQGALADYQRDFTAKVNNMLEGRAPEEAARSFDDLLRKDWPLAQVGFVVTLSGDILCPSPLGGPEARMFCTDNSRFLANRESVEVYWNSKQALNNLPLVAGSDPNAVKLDNNVVEFDQKFSNKSQVARKVTPQQQSAYSQKFSPQEDSQQAISKVAASEAEFRQLIGEANEGTLARFVDNKLNVLFWYRSPRDTRLIFGTQLALARLIEGLQPLTSQGDPGLHQEICVALLDDMAKPVALSVNGFVASWKRPFVATEIGETLPHWEVAVYLLNPAKFKEAAHILKLTLGLLIAILVLAIGIGSWLIVADLNRQLRLASQKTNFVSNVSHELKTPLTSIRMFAELLAENRVLDPAKQRSYLSIITAETARLTRLINNVLDFARLERGEKKYAFKECDIVHLVRETAESYRPNLEANGFKFESQLPASTMLVDGDCDALAQVIVNLLSNAEKYSADRKEISLIVDQETAPLPHVKIQILDCGLGVPSGCEEKIFEQFFRAHDSLSSGIQGSGLGLTLARQIVRAHGGDVIYRPRIGGGSCFIVTLPLKRPPGEAIPNSNASPND